MRKILLSKDIDKLYSYLRDIDISFDITYNTSQSEYTHEELYSFDDVDIDNDGRIWVRINAPFTKGLLLALSEQLKTDDIRWSEESSDGCDTCGYGAGSWLEFKVYGSGLIKQYDSRLKDG